MTIDKPQRTFQQSMARLYRWTAVLACVCVLVVVGFDPVVRWCMPAALMLYHAMGRMVTALITLPLWLQGGVVCVTAGLLHVRFWQQARWDGKAWTAPGWGNRYRKAARLLASAGGVLVSVIICYRSANVSLGECILGTLTLLPLGPLGRHASYMAAWEAWLAQPVHQRTRVFSFEDGIYLLFIAQLAVVVMYAWPDHNSDGLVAMGLGIGIVVITIGFLELLKLPVPNREPENGDSWLSTLNNADAPARIVLRK